MVSYNPRGKIQRVKHLEDRERRRLARLGRARHRRAIRRILLNDFDIDLLDDRLNYGMNH